MVITSCAQRTLSHTQQTQGILFYTRLKVSPCSTRSTLHRVPDPDIPVLSRQCHPSCIPVHFRSSRGSSHRTVFPLRSSPVLPLSPPVSHFIKVPTKRILFLYLIRSYLSHRCTLLAPVSPVCR